MDFIENITISCGFGDFIAMESYFLDFENSPSLKRFKFYYPKFNNRTCMVKNINKNNFIRDITLLYKNHN